MKTEFKSSFKDKRLIVAASGSIAAVKTPMLISSLVKAGAIIKCVLTPSAAHLVSPIALASLSRNRCYLDEDQWSPNEPRPLHIALAEWAEMIIVAPLSASTMARWSHGLGEGLLASLLLAYEKPVIAAAAMNTGMWSNQAVQNNWEQLAKNPKILRLEPESGLLACDREGEGRMVNQDLIELSIQSAFLQLDAETKLRNDWKGKRLLVTAGPTVEALDPARTITNRSSGKMGVLIAQAARFRGAKVDLIHGPLQIPNGWLEGLKTYPIQTAEEMAGMLLQLQPKANAVCMSAAVSDIRKKNPNDQKKLEKKFLLASIAQDLEEVPDLLAEIVPKRPHGQVIMGFAAITGNKDELKRIGEAKRKKKGCDLLLANPIDIPNQGFEEDFNGGWLIGNGDISREIPRKSKLALAHELLDAILKSEL